MRAFAQLSQTLARLTDALGQTFLVMGGGRSR
jgi:hypothetical protein